MEKEVSGQSRSTGTDREHTLPLLPLHCPGTLLESGALNLEPKGLRTDLSAYLEFLLFFLCLVLR